MRIAPAFVRVHADGGCSQYYSFTIFEFAKGTIEGDQLSRTYERETQWVEQKADRLTIEFRQLQALELAITAVICAIACLKGIRSNPGTA